MSKSAGMIDRTTLDRELADYASQRTAAEARAAAAQERIAAAQHELNEATKAFLTANGAHQAIAALIAADQPNAATQVGGTPQDAP